MKYINNKIIAFTLIAASIMSCTDEYDCQLQVGETTECSYQRIFSSI